MGAGSTDSKSQFSVLVEEWNTALVNRDYQNLEDLYADEVFVYGDLRTNREVVSLKRKSLEAYELWLQRIHGPIGTSRVPQNNQDLVKAEFLKVFGVEEDMDTVLAYLVFEQTESTWRIVQESDFSTDLVLLKRSHRTQKAENVGVMQVEEPIQEAEIDLDWYWNYRYGWSVSYPSFFEPQGESFNGDGQIFQFEDLKITASFDSYTRCILDNMPCEHFRNRVQFQTDTLENEMVICTKRVSTSVSGMSLHVEYPLSRSVIIQPYIDLLRGSLAWNQDGVYDDSIIAVSNRFVDRGMSGY